MEQVATHLSNHVAEPVPQPLRSAKQLTACLRLKQGASAQGTFLIEDVPGGTQLSIGADPMSDWQIRAASVADHALDVMMLSGTVFARCPEESNVLLNGRPLEQQWTEVTDGSRIDIGLARLEVNVGEANSAFDHLPQAFVPPTFAAKRNRTAPKATLEFAPQRENYERVREFKKPLIDTQSEVSEPAQTLPDPHLISDARISFSERPTLSDRAAPSLLEEERLAEAPSRSYWRYAMVGLGTAFAYGGWVLLLDQM